MEAGRARQKALAPTDSMTGNSPMYRGLSFPDVALSQRWWVLSSMFWLMAMSGAHLAQSVSYRSPLVWPSQLQLGCNALPKALQFTQVSGSSQNIYIINGKVDEQRRGLTYRYLVWYFFSSALGSGIVQESNQGQSVHPGSVFSTVCPKKLIKHAITDFHESIYLGMKGCAKAQFSL